MKRPHKITVRQLRSLAFFLGGSFIAYHEILVRKSADPSALAFAAGLLGLPVFLNQDEDD